MAKLHDYPLTIKDAAHRLGVTPNAVRRFVAAGKLKAERFGPLRELRFREEDLEAFQGVADPVKLHNKLLQLVKQIEPHYQRLLDQFR